MTRPGRVNMMEEEELGEEEVRQESSITEEDAARVVRFPSSHLDLSLALVV